MTTLESVQTIFSGSFYCFKEMIHILMLSFEGSVDAFVCKLSSLILMFVQENSIKLLFQDFECLSLFMWCTENLRQPFLNFTTRKIWISKSYTPSVLHNFYLEAAHGHDKRQPIWPHLNQNLTSLVLAHCIRRSHRDSEKQRSKTESVCNKFVENMIQSLNSRVSNYKDCFGYSFTIFNLFISADKKGPDIKVVYEYLGTVWFQDFHLQFLDFVVFVVFKQGSMMMWNSRNAENHAIHEKEVYPALAEAGLRKTWLEFLLMDKAFLKWSWQKARCFLVKHYLCEKRLIRWNISCPSQNHGKKTIYTFTNTAIL